MKIGITERGDAGLNLEWKSKLKDLDGLVLITKNLNPLFRSSVIEVSKTVPTIVHATITGWGGTYLEPNVPSYIDSIQNLRLLINSGFSAENCVLRIDPIIPTDQGLKLFDEVVDCVMKYDELKQIRVRISILDEYFHVQKRLIDSGHPPFYSSFYPSRDQILSFKGRINYWGQKGLVFETCAEPYLTSPYIIKRGCISLEDIHRMGLKEDDSNLYVNPQNRKGCLCLSCKTELLTQRKRCPHQCLYCYWFD